MSASETGESSSAGRPFPRETHRSDARCVYHAAHAVLLRRAQNRSRPFHIRAVHLGRIPHPKPIVGSHVKNHLAARHRLFQGGRIAQIARRGLSLQTFEVLQITGQPYQQSQISSLVRESAGYVGA